MRRSVTIGPVGERTLTGVERKFNDDQIIVSKTDPTGKITYANELFCRISGYTEAELIGAPHSILRHPAMPRIVYKLLWERVQGGHELFAFVVNRCREGDEYWVYAHVSPTFRGGEIVGYHSNRRTVNRTALPEIKALYETLRAEEQRQGDKRSGLAASGALLERFLAERGQTYDELVWSFENRGSGDASIASRSRRAVAA